MPARSPLSRVNDFVVRFANVNGSGSASANELFARAVLRMGVPVSSRNIFPSNIQGLPTWFEVRVCEAGHLGARGGIDLMVAMNPQTWDKDVAGIEPGGYLFYDSTKPMPASKFRDDIVVLGVPLTAICNREYTDPRQRQLFKNIIYLGALVGAARHRARRDRGAVLRAVQGQGKADRRQQARAPSRPRLGDAQHGAASRHRSCLRAAGPARRRGRRSHLYRRQFGRRARRRLWRRDGVRLVPADAVLVAGRRFHELLRQAARTIRRPARRKYAIIQGEDEIASIGIVVGAGWNGARAFTATSGPGISLMQEFCGLGLFRRNSRGDFRRAARRAVHRHADPHPAIRRAQHRLCVPWRHQARACCFRRIRARPSNSRALSFDLADRLQTPIFVLLDLEIGMNQHLCAAARLGRQPRI